jgi:peptidoglycan hydrolase CwlO-like protein
MLIAVLTLMGITSMGIFGFLTSAYQSSLVEFSQAETQQTFMVSQKAILQKELDSLTMRVETLNQSRLSQEKRLPEMSRAAAKPVYEDIAKAGEEISQTRTRMNQVFEEIKTLDLQTLEAQKQSGKQKDIGTLKYAAELFNTDINTIVKWFTLAIIVVFDPLAIALVLGYNIAANRTFEEEEVTEETKKKVNIITKTFFDKAKYRN